MKFHVVCKKLPKNMLETKNGYAASKLLIFL